MTCFTNGENGIKLSMGHSFIEFVKKPEMKPFSLYLVLFLAFAYFEAFSGNAAKIESINLKKIIKHNKLEFDFREKHLLRPTFYQN